MMILMGAAGVMLAALFAMSAIAKSVDPSASTNMLHELGLPERWSGLAGRALVFSELLIAVGLLAGPFRRLAADAALIVLVAFTVAVTKVAWSGRKIQCGCFGTASEPQPAAAVVGRNLLLGVLAGMASRGVGDLSGVGWAIPTPLAAGLGAAGMVVMVVVGLRGRASGVDEGRRSGTAGREGGQVVVRRTNADPVTLSELVPSLPVLVLFLDTDCPGCAALLDRPVPEHSGDIAVLTLVVDRTGARPDLRARNDVVVVAPETFTEAGVPGTPCGMLFGPAWQQLGEPLLGERAIGFALAAATA